jgi:hypothetical protein
MSVSRLLFRMCAVLTGCFLVVSAVGLFINVPEIMKLGALGACWSIFGMLTNSKFFFGGNPG